ncbi:unnamed protein product, partial [Closterium sp. NIES-54]
MGMGPSGGKRYLLEVEARSTLREERSRSDTADPRSFRDPPSSVSLHYGRAPPSPAAASPPSPSPPPPSLLSPSASLLSLPTSPPSPFSPPPSPSPLCPRTASPFSPSNSPPPSPFSPPPSLRPPSSSLKLPAFPSPTFLSES